MNDHNPKNEMELACSLVLGTCGMGFLLPFLRIYKSSKIMQSLANDKQEAQPSMKNSSFHGSTRCVYGFLWAAVIRDPVLVTSFSY